MEFKEPVRGWELDFRIINRNQLIPSRYQRDMSNNMVKKLVESVDQAFLIPLLVVEHGNMFEVIDGQHRLAALDKCVTEMPYEVPCILCPPKFRDMPLLYNIEKSDNIKDKATKVHRVYMDCTAEHPEDWTETELQMQVLSDWYLFDMAFAYKEFDLKSPSLVEPLAKKFSLRSSEPLSIAIDIRRDHGKMLATVEETVNALALDAGIREFFVKKSMISRCTMSLWGRKRNLDVGFDDGIAMVLQELNSEDWATWAGM